MHVEQKRKILSGARRIVVKLGSSVVATTSGVDTENVGRLTAEISRLREQGYEIVVVTSGARAAGLAIVIALFRLRGTTDVDEINLLKW